MYAGRSFVLSVILSSLCGQSIAFWPFTPFTVQVQASTDAPEHTYPDANAKRVAIIGTRNLIDFILALRQACFPNKVFSASYTFDICTVPRDAGFVYFASQCPISLKTLIRGRGLCYPINFTS